MFEGLHSELLEKYGDDFNWSKIAKTNNFFIDELNVELSKTHPLYNRVFKAVAKCDSNDDVLFLLHDDNYAIVHLSYSKSNINGFPLYKEFTDLQEAIHYIEDQFVSEYLCK